jgi:hypothetical protein
MTNEELTEIINALTNAGVDATLIEQIIEQVEIVEAEPSVAILYPNNGW